MKKPVPLYAKILLAIMVALAGAWLAKATLPPPITDWLVEFISRPVGRIFTRLILMLSVPLAFCALSLGTARIFSAGNFGRIASKTIIYTAIFSLISVAIAVTAANIAGPGRGIPQEQREALLLNLRSSNANEAACTVCNSYTSPSDIILNFIPENPLYSGAFAFEGGFLPLMFFAFLFGVAMAKIPRETARPLLELIASLYAAVMKILDYIMLTVPYGAAALVFSAAANMGHSVFAAIGSYVGLVIACLMVQTCVTYPLFLVFSAHRSPIQFFKDIVSPAATAFASSSSNAALPLSLKTAKENLGISPATADFVLTAGANANQNGTAIYEGLTILFLAQLSGAGLGLWQQTQIVLISLAAGLGAAGIPGGSIPFIMVILRYIGVPPEYAVLVLGFERVLDMARTAVNSIGDLVIAACVDAGEKSDGQPGQTS